MKYYLIAGEASGDLHGSNLIRGIKEADSNAEFRFWGGDLMSEAAGTAPVRHYRDTAVMGFVEVLGNARKIIGNLNKCKSDILEYRPDAVILIDYPGFNLKIAKFAKKHNFKVLYYIAPKVWAWKENRIKTIRKYVDRLYIIFPFETEYFRKKGIEAIYEGNPLPDTIRKAQEGFVSRSEFLSENGLEGKDLIAVLAGSRKMEIKYLLPRLMLLIDSHPELNFVIAGAPSIDETVYTSIILKYFKTIPQNLKIIKNRTYELLTYADAAIISSGTASLEAAIIKTPQVVCYGANRISFWIAKHFVKLRYISLANLILDKGIFKELLQDECNIDNIEDELERLLYNETYRNTMIGNYEKVIECLQANGEGAAARIGKNIYNYLATGK